MPLILPDETVTTNKNLEYYMALPYPFTVYPPSADTDGQWKATIVDLNVDAYADTYEDLLFAVDAVKQGIIEMVLEDGLAVPEPAKQLA